MAFPTVEQSWQQLADAIFDKTHPPAQRMEMKKAFFAGALAVLHNAEEMDNPEISVEEGADYFVSAAEEVRKFFKDQINEHANRNICSSGLCRD